MGNMEKELQELRARIDALDDDLMALLRKRAGLTAAAGEIKRQHHAKFFARLEREADIVRRLSPMGGEIPPAAVRAIYREIISACLAVEKPQRIAYLGPEHTFTHEAARKHFGDSADYLPADGLRDALAMAEKEVCDFAVLPFENSNEGTVGDTFDLLLSTPLQIGGEIMLRVRHNLWAAAPEKLEKLQTVFAHPQALAQCRRWLEKNAPQATMAAVESNAAAARLVAEHADSKSKAKANIAAIASQSAGRHHQLAPLAEDIEDSAQNTTRFFILGGEPPRPTAADKTSFLMTADSKPGALYHLLEPLSRLGINMTKFESRPARGQLWEFLFFVDIDGHRNLPETARALEEISGRAAFLKILGSYPKADD